jgi:hypothetical protein
MTNSSGFDESPLGPQLCPPPAQLKPADDDGITAVRGMLIAATASIVLWGLGIVLVMLIRARS